MYVETPYYLNIVDVEDMYDKLQPEANYTPYQVYCLKNRLEQFFYDYDRELTFNLARKRIGNRMVLCVDVFYLSGEFLTDEDFLKEIQEQVNEITSKHPDHFIVFDSREPIRIDGEIVNCEEWVKKVCFFLFIDKKYDPFYMNGMIYVNCSKELNYKEATSEIHQEILDKLCEMYKRGVVPASSKQAERFGLVRFNNVSNRELIKTMHISEGHPVREEYELYCPPIYKQINKEFIPQLMKILREGVNFLTFSLSKDSLLSNRHFIKKEFETAVFTHSSVFIELENESELVETINRFYEVIKSPRKHLENKKMMTMCFPNFRQAIKALTLSREKYFIDGVIYEVIDDYQRPYYFSFMMSKDLDISSIQITIYNEIEKYQITKKE